MATQNPNEQRAVELRPHQYDCVQEQYAEVHELKTRLEIAGRMSQQTLNMLVMDAGLDPQNYDKMRLLKKDGKLLLVLYPVEQKD